MKLWKTTYNNQSTLIFSQYIKSEVTWDRENCSNSKIIWCFLYKIFFRSFFRTYRATKAGETFSITMQLPLIGIRKSKHYFSGKNRIWNFMLNEEKKETNLWFSGINCWLMYRPFDGIIFKLFHLEKIQILLFWVWNLF